MSNGAVKRSRASVPADVRRAGSGGLAWISAGNSSQHCRGVYRAADHRPDVIHGGARGKTPARLTRPQIGFKALICSMAAHRAGVQCYPATRNSIGVWFRPNRAHDDADHGIGGDAQAQEGDEACLSTGIVGGFGSGDAGDRAPAELIWRPGQAPLDSVADEGRQLVSPTGEQVRGRSQARCRANHTQCSEPPRLAHHLFSGT